MKIKIFTGVLLMFSQTYFAQQNPTGSPVPSGYTTAQQAASAWYRGGNNFGNTAGFNNIFGTAWNSPIYTITNNIVRTRLNGTLINNYNGYNHDVTGHFGIGLDNYFATNTPLTMLHLEGLNNTTFQFGQYRGWMRTGVFMRENSDGMYVGLKPEGFNRSDAVINWSDDAGGKLS